MLFGVGAGSIGFVEVGSWEHYVGKFFGFGEEEIDYYQVVKVFEGVFAVIAVRV